MYNLYVENDNDFADWDITINISDIWDKYETVNKNFLFEYKTRINQYKNDIIYKKGVNVWNNLVLILNDIKDANQANGKLDEVYNWADENNILIKT